LLENTSQTKRAKRTKKPKHRTVARAYDFVMEIGHKQHEKLMTRLRACWRLRNGLVRDRENNRRENKAIRQQGTEAKVRYLTRADQYKAISEYARRDTGLSLVHSQVRQNVAVRVDEGYKRFFDALKKGQTDVHPPKCIELKRYRSLTYPQYGSAAHIGNSKLYLSGLGEFKLYDHRRIKGKPKTVTVKFKQGRWHCIVTAEIQEKDVITRVRCDDDRLDACIDTGLDKLMTDSHGEEYDPPKAWYDHRKQLRKAQKKLSRQFEARQKKHEAMVAEARASGRKAPALKDMPYSNRLRRQIRKVATIHTKIERIRDYHHKKNADVIADRYRRLAVEEHSVKFMIRNRRLAKVASDRAIHKQKLLLQSKLGKRYIAAPNIREEIGGNSQTCTCGAPAPKELKDRMHVCPVCGLVGKRDHVSANIISIIIFGCVSLSLAPEAGQAFVRRGEDEARRGEGLLCESVRPALEFSGKRRSPVRKRNTAGGEPTTGGDTRVHDRVRPVLPREPQAVHHEEVHHGRAPG